MKFFIILFISFIVNILCDSNNYKIYNKSQLRNLLEEKKNELIQMLIDGVFNNIYSNVISYASTNINEFKFSMFCCSDNMHIRCIPMYPIPEYYNINITSIIPSILIKIKNVFPDIDITTEPFNNIDNNNNNNYNRLACDEDIRNIYTLFW
jgi:hypothetical protein